jgi:ferredoxin/flavodoxin
MSKENSIIYYFSATGNSLTFARKLASELGEAELVSIPKALKEGNVSVETSNIGLIFPVYAWGPPRMVAEFIEKLRPKKGQYVFAVATCAAIPGGTLSQVKKMLKKNGSDLNAGFVVRAPDYSLFPEPVPVKMMSKMSDTERFEYGDVRLKEIVKQVKKRMDVKAETNSFVPKMVGNAMHGPAIDAFKKTCKSFKTDEECRGCGTCAKVCPRGNIEIVDKRPVWKDDCEGCFACAQWCPRGAIRFDNESVKGKTGHNREVKLKDMIEAMT